MPEEQRRMGLSASPLVCDWNPILSSWHVCKTRMEWHLGRETRGSEISEPPVVTSLFFL